MAQKISKEAMIRELADRTPESGRFWQQSRDVVPGGLLSQARRFQPYPFYTDRGVGPYLWDIDGNRYLDCCLSYGVQFLGHSHPAVVRAATAQVGRGLSYGTPHTLEVEYARRFIESVPCAEMMLLCNSGTEATMQGIRIMRAFTKKDRIAKFEGCYHGWHDYAQWSVAVDPEQMGPSGEPHAVPGSAGIPEAVRDTILLLPFEPSAFNLIETHAHELAGVMIEPVIGGGTLPVEKSFLKELREVTSRLGIPLMFDEVITGFRLALGGAQEVYGILPDLATYGKIIGGGFPVGAVACSKKMMDTVMQTDDGFSIAGTFSGNPITLAAGNAVLDYLMDNPRIYPELADRGDCLRSGFNQWANTKGFPAVMTGTASMFQLHLKEGPVRWPRDLLGQNEDALGDLQLYLRSQGVFFPWLHLAFLSTAHEDAMVEELLRVAQSAVEHIVTLHGEMN